MSFFIILVQICVNIIIGENNNENRKYIRIYKLYEHHDISFENEEIPVLKLQNALKNISKANSLYVPHC